MILRESCCETGFFKNPSTNSRMVNSENLDNFNGLRGNRANHAYNDLQILHLNIHATRHLAVKSKLRQLHAPATK